MPTNTIKEAWKNIDLAKKLGVPEEDFYQPIMQELEKALPYEEYKKENNK